MRRIADVVLDEGEVRLALKGRHILSFAGDEVIKTDDCVAIRVQTLAQVRPDKPRPPGHENVHLTSHRSMEGGVNPALHAL